MKPAATDSPTLSYVTLGVENNTFAVDVGAVREILDYQTISPLPHAPPFLVGMIDVRGLTVPVVDLRRKLGLADGETTCNSRILVLEVTIAGRLLVMGLLCDRVFDVAEMATLSLEAAPEIGMGWNSRFIKAIGRWHGNFVIIINLEHLFSSNEIARLNATL